jgi:hypothetical protein
LSPPADDVIALEDPRLRFDIRNWTPAAFDAPYVNPGAWEALNDLALTPARSRNDLYEPEARARRLSPENGIVDYVLAGRFIEWGDGTAAMRLVDCGNRAQTLYAPFPLPCSISHAAYLARLKQPLRSLLFWHARDGTGYQKAVLATEMLRRIVLCAPLCRAKVVLFLANWRFLTARDFASHLLSFRVHRAVQDMVVFGKLRKATVRLLAPAGEHLETPAEVRTLVRRLTDELGGLTGEQFKKLMSGAPIADRAKMARIEERAQKDYAAEYAQCLEWIEEIKPGSREPSR